MGLSLDALSRAFSSQWLLLLLSREGLFGAQASVFVARGPYNAWSPHCCDNTLVSEAHPARPQIQIKLEVFVEAAARWDNGSLLNSECIQARLIECLLVARHRDGILRWRGG